MRRLREAAAGGPVILLAFGTLMALHTAVTAAFTHVGATTPLLLGGTAVAAWLLGLITLAWRLAGRRDAGAPLVVPGVSLPTALLGAGLAGLAVGAFAGPWLVVTAAGAIVLALAGLVREWRAGPR